MNFLIDELIKNAKFKNLVEQINLKESPIGISGLTDVAKMQLLIALQSETKQPICILSYNEIQAKKLCQDLKEMGSKAYFFPKKEIAAYDYTSQSKDLSYERIAVLNQIELAKEEKKPIIVVTTIEAVMQNMPSKEELYKDTIYFKVGKVYPVEKLKEILVGLGYEREDLIENKGQFSIRGGIVDVGLSEKIGVRIEFWGDEVDSIRYFQISSQRSTQMLQEITIFPAHEYIVPNLEKTISKIKKQYEEQTEDIELMQNR